MCGLRPLWVFVLVLGALLAACSSSRWRPADPENPNRVDTVTGTLTALSIPEAGDVDLRLRPDPDFQRFLAPGQREIEAYLPAEHRGNFERLFPLLETGSRVEICGYLLSDESRGGIHVLRPITAIDPYPDSQRR